MVSLREIADTWASWYANSAALRSTVGFAHVAGLVGGGGCAVAADLGAIAALSHGPAAMMAELQRIARVHRIVIGGLSIVVVSGIFLMLADLDAYLQSVAFWIKMLLVGALVANGAVLVRVTGRDWGSRAFNPSHLRLVSLISLSLWFLTTLLGAVLPNAL